MHMADALLSPAVGGVMWGLSVGGMACAAVKLKKEEVSEQKLPVMAVSGAFVFAAQMINFTIPGTGSSGHIGGGILLASLLGGFPALLTIAAVLVIQCLFFADGGLLALGANIFNMGVIPCLLIYPLLTRPLLRRGVTPRRLTVASILSVVIALQLGAFSVVLETLASGITELPFAAFAGMMQPIHLAIGLVEGVVTAAVLVFVRRARPELLDSALERRSMGKGVSVKGLVLVLAALALVVGAGLSWFASSNPDGLEWSMEHTAGTAELEREDGVHQAADEVQQHTAFLPDYDFSAGQGTGTGAAGIVGAALTCALAVGVGAGVSHAKKRRRKNSGEGTR